MRDRLWLRSSLTNLLQSLIRAARPRRPAPEQECEENRPDVAHFFGRRAAVTRAPIKSPARPPADDDNSSCTPPASFISPSSLKKTTKKRPPSLSCFMQPPKSTPFGCNGRRGGGATPFLSYHARECPSGDYFAVLAVAGGVFLSALYISLLSFFFFFFFLRLLRAFTLFDGCGDEIAHARGARI